MQVPNDASNKSEASGCARGWLLVSDDLKKKTFHLLSSDECGDLNFL